MKLPDWNTLTVELKPRQGLCCHPPSYSVRPAWFRRNVEDFNFWYTISGREWIQHKSGERHLLQRGSCFLIRPRAEWNCIPVENSNEDWTMVYIHFRLRDAVTGKQLPASVLDAFPTVIQSYHAEYVEAVCKRILMRGYEWKQKDPLPPLENDTFRSSCALFKAMLQDIALDDARSTERNAPAIPPWHHARLVNLLSAVKADPKRYPGIPQMAATLNVSEDYFRRIFRKTFGISPQQALTTARIDRATLLLRSTDASIATVAAECGFDNTHYFSRIFKQVKNVTPREYRREASKPTPA